MMKRDVISSQNAPSLHSLSISVPPFLLLPFPFPLLDICHKKQPKQHLNGVSVAVIDRCHLLLASSLSQKKCHWIPLSLLDVEMSEIKKKKKKRNCTSVEQQGIFYVTETYALIHSYVVLANKWLQRWQQCLLNSCLPLHLCKTF